jgi:hypothetical protein
MIRRRYFPSFLLLLLLAGVRPAGWAAEEAANESPPKAEEEVITEPAAPTPKSEAPPKKHSTKRRANVPRGAGTERVEIGKDVTVKAGEVVRELVVIGGNATVDGTVEGDLVVISGSATVNGRVKRDSVTILGSLTLGPQAHISHDAVVVGGPLNADPGATIGGEQTVVGVGQFVPDFGGLQKWLNKGVMLARPLPPGVRWVWIAAAAFLLLYLALAVLFPRPVRACVMTLEEQPVASFFMGLLLLVLLGPLLFLLVVSVAGLLAIPFLIFAVIFAVLLGKAAVYAYAGQQVGRQVHISEASLPLLLIIGAALFYIIYMVPFLGFAVWAIVTLIGMGAVLLAGFGSFRREPAPAFVGAAYPAAPPPFPDPVMAGEGTGSATATLVAPPAVLGPTDTMLLPRIGFWRRLCATLLDFLLLCMLIRLTGSLFLVVWSAYHVAMWTWKGTTIGGIVMNIKLVRTDGRPIDFAVALVRSLSSFFSAFALFLGFFWAGWDRERQAWHDKIAGTVVVKMPRGMSLI